MVFKKLPFLLLTVFALTLSMSLHAQKTEKKKRGDAKPKVEKPTKGKASPAVKTNIALGDIQIEIKYGSPAVKGREIWGGLVPLGKVWRTGANEATTFEINEDVLINGSEVKAGKYALFTIPGKTEWTFILNSVAEQWGAYRYDESKDVLRFTAKPGSSPTVTERMTFEGNTKGDLAAYINLKWDKLIVGFEVRPANR